MWGRTNESKPPLSSPEPPSPPSPISLERPASTAPAEARQLKTLLGSGLALKGELLGREDVTIDGQFEGQIRVTGAGVTIGANGRLTAEVEADEIIVEGGVDGSLRARERVVIRRSGKVTGDIETLRLLIEDGAIFRGHVEMARPGETLAARPASTARAEKVALHRVPVEASETVS
jgi:cytoskeletal protein CcmA (bactofilin family)